LAKNRLRPLPDKARSTTFLQVFNQEWHRVSLVNRRVSEWSLVWLFVRFHKMRPLIRMEYRPFEGRGIGCLLPLLLSFSRGNGWNITIEACHHRQKKQTQDLHPKHVQEKTCALLLPCGVPCVRATEVGPLYLDPNMRWS
jgi:hypothetical protein